MPKPESWRQDPEVYPFSASLQTRFGDMDVMGHINNVAMAGLFETGRVMFNRSLGLAHLPGERWLIAKVCIDYIHEAHFPKDIVIGSGITRIGTRSWTIASAGFQSGTCVALCDTVVVYTETHGGSAIPDEFRTVFDANRIMEPARAPA